MSLLERNREKVVASWFHPLVALGGIKRATAATEDSPANRIKATNLLIEAAGKKASELADCVVVESGFSHLVVHRGRINYSIHLVKGIGWVEVKKYNALGGHQHDDREINAFEGGAAIQIVDQFTEAGRPINPSPTDTQPRESVMTTQEVLDLASDIEHAEAPVF